MAQPKYDHKYIAALRDRDWSWESIANESLGYMGLGVTAKQLRQAHSRWLKRQGGEANTVPGDTDIVQGESVEHVDGKNGLVAKDDQTQVCDRLPSDVPESAGFPTDVEQGEGEASEQPAVDGSSPSPLGFSGWDIVQKWDKTPEGTVHLKPSAPDPRQQAVLDAVWEDWVADAAEHAPDYYSFPWSDPVLTLEQDSMMAILALFDPHFGMLAWRHEVGHDYDLSIAVKSYTEAVEGLLPQVGLYPTERILYLVGNDFLHVDGPGSDARGNRRGGATTAGTAQDIEGRLAKMFTMGRRALVAGIDRASSLAPVEVLVVPGNHDREQMYRMGEVLAAWYRNDTNVTVTFSPNKRSYYLYGSNAFMFTHGEELRRKRDPLPLIMATEIESVIPGAWAASQGGNREIITGHHHIGMAGGYFPTADLDETRGIRTRSIAGMTPEDAWHHEEGYKHHRAATLLVYRRAGGLAGFHEMNL